MLYISLLIGVLSSFELANYVTFCGFISKDVEARYLNIDESKLKLNERDPSILDTEPYITNVVFSFFSKYYINGMGTIPRWSKLHKKVKEYYRIAFYNTYN